MGGGSRQVRCDRRFGKIRQCRSKNGEQYRVNALSDHGHVHAHCDIFAA